MCVTTQCLVQFLSDLQKENKKSASCHTLAFNCATTAAENHSAILHIRFGKDNRCHGSCGILSIILKGIGYGGGGDLCGPVQSGLSLCCRSKGRYWVVS